jgi:hypothetical protein
MAALVLAGCSGQSGSDTACGTEACLTERYFDAHPDTWQACSPVSSAERLDSLLDMRLYWGGGAGDDRVIEQASRLQRFYRPYGLELRTSREAVDSLLRYAMSGSQDQLDAALEAAGIPTQGTLSADEQHRANRAVGGVIFAGLREFVLSRSPSSAVHLVVLEHVMAPELAAALWPSSSQTIIGFGISPRLFDAVSASDPQYDLYEMTGLSGNFAPAVFIGDADVGDLPGSPDNLVAHEVGHALGLAHTIESGNLMVPGQNRDCEESLSSAQLAEMRQALGGEQAAVSSSLATVAPTGEWFPQLVAAAVRSRQVRHAARLSPAP